MKANVDLLIDDYGNIWKTSDGALYDHLAYRRNSSGLTQYLIRNLGFVRFETGRIGVQITLWPRFLTEEALDTLVGLMVRHDPGRFVIAVPNSDQPIAILHDLEDAAARLAGLGTIGDNIRRPDFIRQPLSLLRLRGQPRLQPIGASHRKWRRCHGELRGSLDAEFGDPRFCGRVLVVRMTHDAGGIYEYVGDGFPNFLDKWRPSMVGQIVGEQPDPQYAQNAGAAYLETHLTQTPHLELVEALVRSPGGPPLRIRYERLLLPWSLGETRFVSVVSVVRTSLVINSDI